MKSSFTSISKITPGASVMLVFEPVEEQYMEIQQKDAQALSTLLSKSTNREGIINADDCYYAYLIDNQMILYLASYQLDYPKKLAFSYLEEIRREFNIQCSADVVNVKRPFSFQNFDVFIKRTKKVYYDTKSQRTLNTVAENLKDIENILVENMNDIIDRGNTLNSMNTEKRRRKITKS